MASVKQSPEAYYKAVLSEKKEAHEALALRLKQLFWVRLMTGVAFIILFFSALNYNTDILWYACAGSVVLFLLLVKVNDRVKEKAAFIATYISVLEGELNALKGDWSGFADGRQYIDANHAYSYDLDVFGKGSVFQMLCRTVTIQGNNLLANLLQRPYASVSAIKERQAITKELSGKPDFLQLFRTSGLTSKEQENDIPNINKWLSEEDNIFSDKLNLIALLLLPLASAVFLTISAIQLSFHPAMWLIIALNAIMLARNSQNIKRASLLIGRNAAVLEKYEKLIHTIISQEFSNDSLAQLKKESVESAVAITKLKKLAHLFESKSNPLVGPLMNALFMFDMYCVFRLERWRAQYKKLLLHAFNSVTELDAQVSLAVYTFNHPDNVYPVVTDNTHAIVAEDITHPLLKASAIGSDCSIGEREQFYLLTGANMTGKSTFIRTVGVSTVMAYMGLPILAKSLQLPLLKLLTSIRVTDSVQDDVSYFKAELNRIHNIMEEVSGSDSLYLILLDEPLRGTNSGDKQAGTQAILEKLIKNKAIGILATHDTGLCRLENEHAGKISNYHFESTLEANELHFDYKLKSGCSQSSNATILMKQMGII